MRIPVVFLSCKTVSGYSLRSDTVESRSYGGLNQKSLPPQRQKQSVNAMTASPWRWGQNVPRKLEISLHDVLTQTTIILRMVSQTMLHVPIILYWC